MATSPGGYDEECPCIDSSPILSKLAFGGQNCSFATGAALAATSDLTCYPFTYGASRCAAHDQDMAPFCNDPDNLADFCPDLFCFVDPEKCRWSSIRFFKSNYFSTAGLFYSYSTCNNSRVNPFVDVATTAAFQNTTIKVAIPGSLFPYHYKRTSDGDIGTFNGPEYFDDTIPFEGSIIDYLDAVRLNNMDIGFSFDFTFTQSEYTSFSTSRLDDTILRVKDGIVDVAASIFSITETRLSYTASTIPLVVDKNFLWVPKPTIDNSIHKQIKQTTTSVFAPDLWGAILASIFLCAALNVWFSFKRQFHEREYWECASIKPRWKSATLYDKTRWTVYAYTNSVWNSAMDFMGGDATRSFEHPFSKKILGFGFSFFIFVSTAAYTANLAAFLTLQEVGLFIDSVETAIENKNTICIIKAIQGRVEASWPDAPDGVFIYKDSPDELFAGIETGVCDALSIGEIIVGNSEYIIGELHRLDLGTNGAVVVTNSYGIFTNTELVAGFSNILESARNDGIDYRNYAFTDLYVSDLEELRITVTQGENELVPLTTRDMILPFLILIVCAVVAIPVHFYGVKRRKRLNLNPCAYKVISKEEEILKSIEKMKASIEGQLDVLLQKVATEAPAKESAPATE